MFPLTYEPGVTKYPSPGFLFADAIDRALTVEKGERLTEVEQEVVTEHVGRAVSLVPVPSFIGLLVGEITPIIVRAAARQVPKPAFEAVGILLGMFSPVLFVLAWPHISIAWSESVDLVFQIFEATISFI